VVLDRYAGSCFIVGSSLVGYDGAQNVRDEERSVEQEQKPRERSFIRELVPDWRPTREQILWAVRFTIVLVVLLCLLTLIGLPFGITLWEWIKLLIVPAVLALGAFLFTRSENRRAQQIANQRRQDDTLQAYLDQIGQMLLDKDRPLRQSEEGDEVQTLARARTLTTLSLLDGVRKGALMGFLLEANLIQGGLKGRHDPVISLFEADLREADLSTYAWINVDMTAAALSDANLNLCDLEGSRLAGARLVNASLVAAFLADVDLNGAILTGANLYGTDLRRAR
jgi:hypothetical protein